MGFEAVDIKYLHGGEALKSNEVAILNTKTKYLVFNRYVSKEIIDSGFVSATFMQDKITGEMGLLFVEDGQMKFTINGGNVRFDRIQLVDYILRELKLTDCKRVVISISPNASKEGINARFYKILKVVSY